MSVSLCRHVLIFSDALLEYVCEGAGVSSNGGWGSSGKRAAIGLELLAQPLALRASSSSSSSIAPDLLLSIGDGLVFGTLHPFSLVEHLRESLLRLAAVLRFQAIDLGPHAPAVDGPATGQAQAKTHDHGHSNQRQ